MWDLIVSVPDHCLSFYFGLCGIGRLDLSCSCVGVVVIGSMDVRLNYAFGGVCDRDGGMVVGWMTVVDLIQFGTGLGIVLVLLLYSYMYIAICICHNPVCFGLTAYQNLNLWVLCTPAEKSILVLLYNQPALRLINIISLFWAVYLFSGAYHIMYTSWKVHTSFIISPANFTVHQRIYFVLSCYLSVVIYLSPGVGRNTFLLSPHLCFIIVFICDLFVSRDDPLMS